LIRLESDCLCKRVDKAQASINAAYLVYWPDARPELGEAKKGACSAGGTLSLPTVGEFKNGRGEFFNQETLNGRAIYVRFVISAITPNSCRFEQAFSDDGGKTWEVNWIAIDTRVKVESDKTR